MKGLSLAYTTRMGRQMYSEHGGLEAVYCVCAGSVLVDKSFGAQEKLLNSFVLMHGKSDREEKMKAGRVLLLSRCLVKEECEGKKLASMLYL